MKLKKKLFLLAINGKTYAQVVRYSRKNGRNLTNAINYILAKFLNK